MAFTYRQGTFAANTTTGDQVIDTGSVVDMKAVLLWGTNQSATGFSAGESAFFGMCVSSTARKCIAWAADDNVAINNAGQSTQNRAITILSDGTPTVDAAADFVSFGTGANSGKFTINWSKAPAIAATIHYLALGGADITNINITEHAAETVATGNKAYTGVGFQGDFALFIGASVTALGDSAIVRFGMGAATSSTIRAEMWTGGRDARTSALYSKHVTDATSCFSLPVANGNSTDFTCDFVSFDSDGFTLNVTNIATSAYLFFALTIKGGSFDIDQITAPASTGNQSITTGFPPNGVFIFGNGQTTANGTLGNERHMCIGAMGNPTLAGSGIWASEDDVINTDANKYNSTSNCIQVATNPSTIAAQAAPVSLDSNGYTINWTTTASGRRFFGVAFGDTPVAGGSPGLNTLALAGAGK